VAAVEIGFLRRNTAPGITAKSPRAPRPPRFFGGLLWAAQVGDGDSCRIIAAWYCAGDGDSCRIIAAWYCAGDGNSCRVIECESWVNSEAAARRRPHSSDANRRTAPNPIPLGDLGALGGLAV